MTREAISATPLEYLKRKLSHIRSTSTSKTRAVSSTTASKERGSSVSKLNKKLRTHSQKETQEDEAAETLPAMQETTDPRSQSEAELVAELQALLSNHN